MPVHGRSIEDQAAVIMVLMTERAIETLRSFPCSLLADYERFVF